MDEIDNECPGGGLTSQEETVEMKKVSVVYLVSHLQIKGQEKTQVATYELALVYVPKKTEAALI